MGKIRTRIEALRDLERSGITRKVSRIVFNTAIGFGPGFWGQHSSASTNRNAKRGISLGNLNNREGKADVPEVQPDKAGNGGRQGLGRNGKYS